MHNQPILKRYTIESFAKVIFRDYIHDTNVNPENIQGMHFVRHLQYLTCKFEPICLLCNETKSREFNISRADIAVYKSFQKESSLKSQMHLIGRLNCFCFFTRYLDLIPQIVKLIQKKIN